MPTPADLARPLVETLQLEEAALERMNALVQRQLDAVRTRRHETLEVLAIDTGNTASELHRLRAQRDRQTRLLTRVLKLDGEHATLETIADALEGLDAGMATRLRQARQHVRALAADTRRHTDTLNFALQYAATLGRDVIRVLQGAGQPAGLRTYTKGGQHTGGSAPTPYLNQMG